MFVCVGASVGDGKKDGSSISFPRKLSKGKVETIRYRKGANFHDVQIFAIFMVCSASAKISFHKKKFLLCHTHDHSSIESHRRKLAIVRSC